LGYFVINVVVMGVLVLKEAPNVPIWLVDAQESEIGVI
jgi:hypothetical protein